MGSDVLGIIAPHPPIMVAEVGRTDAQVTSASARAMETAREMLVRFDPETLVVMSPHAPAYRDAFAITTAGAMRGDLGGFAAPEVAHSVPGDPDLAEAIMEKAASLGLSTVARTDEVGRAAHLDHGVLVPISFLDRDGTWPLVELSLSYEPYADHRRLGHAVRDAAAKIGRRVAFIASGDCSHRLTPSAPAGYSPRARLFDERLVRLLATGDFDGLATIEPRLVEEAGECGLRSFIALGGFLDGSDAVPRVLSYEGPWGVGYLTAVFAPAQALEAVLGAAEATSEAGTTPASGRKGGVKGLDRTATVAFARRVIEDYVRTGRVPAAEGPLDPGLPDRAGVFVSIHSRGDLRGCIGTIAPTLDAVEDEIAHNAVQAATGDPRFPPITEDELDELEIKVDVLHEPEPVDSIEDLDPRVYGVIVSRDLRRGLLLPDLEGVDTAAQQIDIARRKAGIGPGEPVRLERFMVDRRD